MTTSRSTPATLAALITTTLAALAPATPQAAPGDRVYQSGFLSHEEALRSLEVPDGYELQLVLSDPVIHEPVAAAWDGNGVLYVAEMRTYMQDIDATGEKQPTSRISRHEDTDGDGVYDRHSVFIDGLLLPRMVLPLDDRILVGITDTLDLWTYRDTDNDGVADEKIRVHEGGPRGGNMEHQPSGLVWALDNWIYLTYEAVRYRFSNNRITAERIPRGGGQWGLAQDDDGRLYYSTAGGENPAFFFQQPPQYGMLDLPGQTVDDFRRVFPIAEVPDVQGGLGRVGPNGGLNYFTGCAGQTIFRGDRLPGDLVGDLIIPEPVGRLIRRASVSRADGKTVLRNAYPDSEFIRTRDVNFRPVHAATGPDGCLFIVDMHRGIIQQGNWVAPGSYLRPVVQKWRLDENIGRGRIYRLVHRDHTPGDRPRLLDTPTAGLVPILDHPNGWWRDTAQKLIVLREDNASVTPALRTMALGTTDASPDGRVHALWTLEGTGFLTPDLVVDLLSDPSPRIRAHALRVAEPFLRDNHPDVVRTVAALHSEPHPEVAVQALNSIAFSGTDNPEVLAADQSIAARHASLEAVQGIVALRQQLAETRRRIAEQRRRNEAFAASVERGGTVYSQLCFACHGPDGKGAPLPGQETLRLAPSLAGSPRVLGPGGSLVRVLLHGMTGPLDGIQYPNVMAPMGAFDDTWIADVATYVRNSFGNKAPAIDPTYVAGIRQLTPGRLVPWTEQELESLEAPRLANAHQWRFTASHGAGSATAAVDGNAGSRFTTGTPQVPGMWLQIELPQPSRIHRIHLDTRRSPGDYPRGYEVRVSNDGSSWSDPLASGAGLEPVTDIVFPDTVTRFIRITQTGSVSGLFWSIHEMDIYGKPAPTPASNQP